MLGFDAIGAVALSEFDPVFLFGEAVMPSVPGPLIAWPIFSDPSVAYTPVISGGSWRATLPVANLGDRRLSRIARSTDALTTSTTFDVDLGVARPVDLVALPKHSLSASATVRWYASNVAGNFSAPVYDSGSLTVWPVGATVEDLDGVNVSHVHVLGSPATARYWRCAIADTTNPNGYIDAARVVIAKAWRPSTGMQIGARLGLDTETERIVSDGGAALYRPKPVRRTWDFTVPMLEDAESVGVVGKMIRQLGQHGQVFFVFDAADLYMHERAFLGVLRELSSIEYPFAALQAIPFRLVEEL